MSSNVEIIDLFAESNKKMTKKVGSDKGRIKELEYIITSLDTSFDKGDDCINPVTQEIVLDNEYDALKQELFNLAPDSKIFKTITSSITKLGSSKVVHDPPMTSINKCNGTEEEKNQILSKWIKESAMGSKISSVKKEKYDYPDNWFSMSFKHDGIAVSIEYEDGKLVRAGMRSKSGKDGINVTEKMKYVKGVPQTLSDGISCIIRGELETPISVFNRKCDELGDDAKANPRAHTAGSMNLKTAEEMKNRGIQFTAYNILKLDRSPYKTEIERAKFAKDTLNLNFVKTIPFSVKMLEVFEVQHRRLDFLVDGVVVSVNNLQEQENLGKTGNSDAGNPKGKIAWKFKDEIKKIKVKNIVWQTGRTGNITPVLVFDGVQLEGTTVVKCTAHNLGIIRTNKIGVGSIVEIIKSGKIIPKLKRVIRAYGNVDVPSVCPSCGKNTIKVKGSNNALALVCKNKKCPAQNIKNLNHFLTILGVKGIAESTINKLVECGAVQKPADFYRLTVNGLIKLGITKRTSVLIVARVWMIENAEQEKSNNNLLKEIKIRQKNKINIPFAKLFASFGVKNAGREAGRILADNFNQWNSLKSMSQNDFSALDGIGPIMAQEIKSFFEDNIDLIEDVEQFFNIQMVSKKTGKFANQYFVLSGALEGSKAKWKEVIEGQDGVIKNSVGKQVNFVVAGVGSGAKSLKAKKLGIPIITTTELKKMLK